MNNQAYAEAFRDGMHAGYYAAAGFPESDPAAERCWNCGADFIAVEDDDEYRFSCSQCGADVLDAPAERDPDDAHDERVDREMDR
jgi:hypothetical protein